MRHIPTQSPHRWRRALLGLLLALSFALTTQSAAFAATAPVEQLLPTTPLAGALYGYSIAIDGEIAVVGAPGDAAAGPGAGAAYVYRREGTRWTQVARLIGADTGAFDRFGWSVGICQGWIVVTAPGDAVAGPSSGSAYVFRAEGGQWVQSAKLAAADAQSFDRFGWSVAIDTPRLVIGAYSDSDTAMNAGSAYVFELGGAGWAQEAKLLPSDPGIFDYFGYAVAISGKRIVVGAPYASDIFTQAGLTYVFDRDAAGWSQTARLAAPTAAAGDQFGRAVAVAGDRLLVGAPLHDSDGVDAGATYTFRATNGVWEAGAQLSPEVPSAQGMFGAALALTADRAVIGAPGATAIGPNAGATYLFRWRGADWVEQRTLAAMAPAAQQRMGTSVAVSGNYALSGAYGTATVGANGGAAYAFELDESGLRPVAAVVRPVVDCVEAQADGSYIAHFGYYNSSMIPVSIRAGERNSFSAGEQSLGQPEVFLPGRQHRVFSRVFSGEPMIWSLDGRSARASGAPGQRCR